MKGYGARYRIVCFILCISLMLSSLVMAEEQSTYKETGEYVAPGTYYRNIDLRSDKGIFNINMLEALTSTDYIKIEASDIGKAVGRESVLKQALKKSTDASRVVGAVNGDFFYTKTLKGLASGISIIDGEVRTSIKESTIFGVTSKGDCFIDKLQMTSKLRVRDKELEIKTVNRVRWNNELVLYTPSYGTNTGTTTLCTELVIKDIELPIKSNTSNIGTIYKINKGTKDSEIPEDGVVISAHGAMAEQLSDLNEGEKVAIDINFSRPDVRFAVAGTPRLVVNKKVSDEIKSRSDAKVRHPRTAIGVKDGKVVMVTVDGRQEGFSDGMNLYEFANFLLSQGVENALNLDGGGSTTMVTRKQGQANSILVNSPSDGNQRSVGNSIQIVSYAPISEPKIVKFKNQNVKIFKNSSFKPEFFIMDSYFNLLPKPESIKYATDKKVGQITEDGSYKAGAKIGKSYIDVINDKIKGRLSLEIVDKVASLKINASLINIEPESKVQLNVSAADKNGNKIYIDPSAVKWSSTPKLGRVDANGMFTVGNKSIDGKIIAKVGQVNCEAEVKIGNHPMLLCSFDSLQGLEASEARGKASINTVTDKKFIQKGKGSLMLDYNMNQEESGASAAYIKFKEPVKVEGNPAKLGLWVYGEGDIHWLRGTYTNSDGEIKTINFTEWGAPGWKGWKQVFAKIPKDEAYPIKINQIYTAETENEKKNAGKIYIDELNAIYQ